MKKNILCCAAGLAAALSMNTNATLLTGTFEGIIDGQHSDLTGNITGVAGTDGLSGAVLSGTFTADIDLAPSASINNTVATYTSTLNWIDISINGFNEPFYSTPLNINVEESITVQDGLASDVNNDKFRVLDLYKEDRLSPRIWNQEELILKSDTGFLFGTELDQTISWFDVDPLDNNSNHYGQLSYRYQWQDTDLGINENAHGTIYLTSFNASFAPENGTVPAPSTALLILAGGAALGLRRRK